MELGRAIRAAREKEGLKQEGLAALLLERGEAETSVAQGVVSHWERGTRTPTIQDVTAIESALRLPRGRLFIVAGVVTEVPSIEHAIAADMELTEQSKDALLTAYRAFRDVSRRAPE